MSTKPTPAQLIETIRDCILEALEEELDLQIERVEQSKLMESIKARKAKVAKLAEAHLASKKKK
jgi:hypothetical protein